MPGIALTLKIRLVRQPKPFYRKQTHTFYVQLDGQQINLGSDRADAYRRWRLLMAGVDENVIVKLNEDANRKSDPPPERVTVHKLDKSFLGWVASQPGTTLKTSTKYWYKKHLESFVSMVSAELVAEDVAQADVDRVFRKYGDGWGDNCRLRFSRALARLYNWGCKRRQVKKNSIRDVERPSYQPRDCYLTNDNSC